MKKITQFTKLTIEDDEKRDTVPADVVKTKQVMMNRFETTSTTPPAMHSSLYERMMLETQKILNARFELEIHEKIDNKLVNVTPKPIDVPHETEGYKKLAKKYTSLMEGHGGDDTTSFKSMTSIILKSRSSRAVGFRMSLEDIINGVGSNRMLLDLQDTDRHSLQMVNLDTSTSSLSLADVPLLTKYKLPFIRIVLRKTELQLLFEQHSMTAIKNTEDGNFVEMDNKKYDYLTIGRGKIRSRSEAETQTTDTLYKAREINTNKFQTRDIGTYVSYFEMFDTYKELDDFRYDFNEFEPKKLHISHNQTAEEQFAIIAQQPSFHLASVIIKRLLAGNTFQQGQRRFRNMITVTRTVDKINYKYSLKPMFSIYPASKDQVRKAVSDMSFCYTNGDILAVAYGIYSYQAARLPKRGEVCVWSIKNPRDPERFYNYEVPVVSVEFSPYMPSLLAIGLFDGSVEVRDIAKYNQPAVAISQRSSLSPSVDPVLAIKWIKQSSSNGHEDIDPFISLSQDGCVTLYNIINSPFLSCIKLMSLERIGGVPEGLPGIQRCLELTPPSKRCAQGLNLTKHPTQLDIYYVLTDEGCVYKCSTNYQHHYLQVLKAHEGAINAMDFSPWSPKLFLTCGNDWCIRIWMDGIFQPLVTLKNAYKPYQWAAWSRVHSTVLIAINRKQCEIWDLRRNILKPMSTTIVDTSHNTLGNFSLDGHSIAIGTERGKVIINALDEMPFPPYYQYDTLEKAIYKAVSNYPDLLAELNSIGNFGYLNKGFVKPP